MLFNRKNINSFQPVKPFWKRHVKPVANSRMIRSHQRHEDNRIRQLERELQSRTIGLYIHIPFCKSKCSYCDFYSLPNAENRMDEYEIALNKNILECSENTKSFTVDTVYIGGGTPSIYGERRLQTLLKLVKRNFRISNKCEITVECNPDSVTKSLIKTLRASGVNRISLGMQSAQNDELKAVNRPHDIAQVREAVNIIRNAKIKNLSLDLIYGLPEQSMEDWQSSVKTAIGFNPEHLSLYGLTLEENTPIWLQREKLALADDDEMAERYLWAVDFLAENGYNQYEISNFAKEGFESRHNIKYWLGQEFIGFGASAYSDFCGCRYSYVRDLNAYIDGMNSGNSIVAEQENIPSMERAREYLIFRMRTVYGVNSEDYRQRYRIGFDNVENKLKEFMTQGWVVCDSASNYCFTPQGFLLSNQLIGLLLDEQEKDMLNRVR